MSDRLVGIGLVLVIEGLLWAVAPSAAIRMLEIAANSTEGGLRFAGTASVALGVVIVWLVRG